MKLHELLNDHSAKFMEGVDRFHGDPDSELDDDEIIDLHLLRHDKSHTMVRGKPLLALEKILKQSPSKIVKPLYRGIAQEELHDFEVGETFTTHTYLSFSEDKSVAEKFSKYYKTDKIFALKEGSGFCYWRWLVKELQHQKATDPQAFKDNDGDWDIQSSIREAEWIMPRKQKFKVVGIDNGLIEIEQV